MKLIALLLFIFFGFLGNYTPTDLVEIRPGKYIREKVKEDLEDLLITCPDLKVISAYRSYDYQKELYRKSNSGKVAKPGYSEHQLGIAIDFGDGQCDLEECFYNQCLIDNALKFGFELSYDKDNKQYGYEPWHYRWRPLDKD